MQREQDMGRMLDDSFDPRALDSSDPIVFTKNMAGAGIGNGRTNPGCLMAGRPK